jgi:4a-hydroxytetrahydrobiopterin dehydratase
MEELYLQSSVPVTDNDTPLDRDEIEQLLTKVDGWEVVEISNMLRLQRTIKLEDFNDALHFANKLGEIAEHEEHHPRLIVEWGKITVEWWSHDLGGIHRNDFIMAAKTDDIYERWTEISGGKDIVQETSEESFPASDPPATW